MPSLPTDPRDADAAITGSRLASLGDAPFYRGSVNTGHGDTALIFASDGQLQLLLSCRLVYYVDATFGWCLRYFISYFTVFVQHTDHSLHKLNTTCTIHHLAFHNPYMAFSSAFFSTAVWCRVFRPYILPSRVFQPRVLSRPAASFPR